MITQHHYYQNVDDTVTGSVNAGCNLELSINLKNPVYLSICKYFNK